MQNITKTDRLGLLLTGKANVLQDHQFLHPIGPCEFLDSPEFESRGSSEDKFKVEFFIVFILFVVKKNYFINLCILFRFLL